MANEHQTVIGINPGSRYLGVAVIRDGDLREWNVKVFKRKRTQKKLQSAEKILLELIDLYDPTALSIKVLHPSRRSKYLEEMVVMLKNIARTHRIRVVQYAIEDLKEDSSGPEVINNKRKLTETITAKYPALFHDLNRERGHRNPYHVRMFEAVSLASACYRKLEKSSGKNSDE
jgi:Holliday junction resolvasome RuvABC endonuclease subunit